MHGLTTLSALNRQATDGRVKATLLGSSPTCGRIAPYDVPPRINHTVDQVEPGVWVGTVLLPGPGADSVSTQPLGSSAEATIACARIAHEKGYRT